LNGRYSQKNEIGGRFDEREPQRDQYVVLVERRPLLKAMKEIGAAQRFGGV
jgi:hypothetical protein